jgi:acyl-CoA reductase-like NAD-dependent aldehyde dehydrogenase
MAQPAKKTTARTTRSRTTKAKTPPTLQSFNPRTGEVMREIPTVAPGEVADIVAQARKVAPEWAAIPPQGRARHLREVRHRIYDLREEIIEVVSAECGKPRFEAFAHEVVPPMIMLLENEKTAAKVLKPKKISPLSAPMLPKLLSGTSGRIEYRPFGVVGVITPWNYPITNCFLGFASALAAGNVVVIKPSEVTPGCGELVRKILEPLPSGVATVIQGGGDVGAALVEAGCDKISFIGSPPTGRKICETAAKTLTPVVMELGGKDAAVVCSDADVDLASSGLLFGAFYNAGQTCCSIERAYVVDSVADEFKEQLVSKLGRVKYGTDDAEIGSLTFKRQLEIVGRHVADATKKGARLLAGGPDVGPKNEKGTLWYAPTVLENVNEDMDVIKEETFGPVLTITRVQDEDEAIRRANEDGTNLTASVWSKNKKTIESVGSQLRAGTVTGNQHGETAASGWSPWGGVGESGFGRINGALGLLEFSLPVAVARSTMPMKRLFWYPYDEPTKGAVASAAALFGARGAGAKFKAARSLLSNATKALKNKL